MPIARPASPVYGFVIPRSLLEAAAQCTNGTAAVLTAQYDNLRDSVNAKDTPLTPQTSTFFGSTGAPVFVQKAAFPTCVESTVESPIYAQPRPENGSVIIRIVITESS